MAHWRTTLFARDRGTFLARGGCGLLAPLELLLMQGSKLGFELLIFQFDCLALPSLLIQEAIEFFDLVFVLALDAARFLIAAKDPPRGQPFQIRAPIPVRATKVIGQVLEFGHGQ
jgi:hypothetical protein